MNPSTVKFWVTAGRPRQLAEPGSSCSWPSETPPKDGLWFHFRWQADTELGVWSVCAHARACVCVCARAALLRTASMREEIKGERAPWPSSENGKVRGIWPPGTLLSLPRGHPRPPSPTQLGDPGLCWKSQRSPNCHPEIRKHQEGEKTRNKNSFFKFPDPTNQPLRLSCPANSGPK